MESPAVLTLMLTKPPSTVSLTMTVHGISAVFFSVAVPNVSITAFVDEVS
jgi:hypothetical protein